MCKTLEKVSYGESTLQFIRHQIPFNYSEYDLITVSEVNKGNEKRLGIFALCGDHTYTYYDEKRDNHELSTYEMFITLNKLVDYRLINKIKTETGIGVELKKYLTIEVIK